MRRALLAFALLAAPLSAQISFVQVRDTFPGDVGTIALPITVTTGHGLALYLATEAAGVHSYTISDGTNTYTHVDSLEESDGAGMVADAYTCNATGGALTITVTTTALAWLVVHELSGQATSACLDQHADSTSTSVSPQTRAQTTTGADYVGAALLNGSNFASAGTGFTNPGSSSFFTNEYLIQSSAGSITPTFNGWTASDAWTQVSLMLLPASGGGGSGEGLLFIH